MTIELCCMVDQWTFMQPRYHFVFEIINIIKHPHTLTQTPTHRRKIILFNKSIPELLFAYNKFLICFPLLSTNKNNHKKTFLTGNKQNYFHSFKTIEIVIIRILQFASL